MVDNLTTKLDDTKDTENLGAILAKVNFKGIVYLSGQLGAGKTTLVRGYLRELGYQGVVRSPTFSIFELYQLNGQSVCHLDLYRFNNAAELEDTGVFDYFDSSQASFIEWPEYGVGCLPLPDLCCNFNLGPSANRRLVQLTADTIAGKIVLDYLLSRDDEKVCT